MKNHTSSKNATRKQSIATLFPQNRLIQITINLRNRHYNMLNLTKATLNTHLKTTHNSLCPSHTPATNKTQWALCILAPKMLKPSEHLTRTLHTVHNDSFMTLNIFG